MNRRSMMTKVLGAALLATGGLVAAPVPKEAKFNPNVKTATNDQIREWAATNEKFFEVVRHLEAKGITLDSDLRKSLVDGTEYYGKPSGYDSRYWSLKQARQFLGGAEMRWDDKE